MLSTQEIFGQVQSVFVNLRGHVNSNKLQLPKACVHVDLIDSLNLNMLAASGSANMACESDTGVPRS